MGLVEVPRNRQGTWSVFTGGIGLFAIGVLNGSLTSGTGLFVTLWLVRWFGADYRQAVAYTLVLGGMFWNCQRCYRARLGILGDVRWDWGNFARIAAGRSKHLVTLLVKAH